MTVAARRETTVAKNLGAGTLIFGDATLEGCDAALLSGIAGWRAGNETKD